MRLLTSLLKFLLGFFVVTFIIYWYHLDSKLLRKLYFVMEEKVFSQMERDVKF